MNTLAPGSTLGQYQIIGKIAAGGFGTVYRASHLTMQREVALKVLLPNLSEDKVFVERFKREAQATAALRHPHIVEIYDANNVGECYFLAMEFLPGGNLQTRLAQLREQRKPMSVDEALRITRQIASALDYAHAKGFVHRDIKPSNILIDQGDRYVLTDFGIVSAQDARTKLTMNAGALGTPEYMAPEQAQGKAPDARSDIYALGVVLYEMLAGTPPFTADTPWGVVYKHIKEPPPPISRIRPDLSLSVRQVIDRSMSKDPGARYQTAAQMAAAIDVALGKTTSTLKRGVPVLPVIGGLLGLIALIAFAIAGITLLSGNASNANNAAAVLAPSESTPSTASIISITEEPTATTVVAPTKPATDTPSPTDAPTAEPAQASTSAPSATAPPVPTTAPSPTTPLSPTPISQPVPATTTAPPAAPTPAPTAETNTAGGAPKPGQLINFEQNLNWRRGNQPYGALTRSNEQVHDGRFSAKLAYDFPGVADNFVVFETSLRLAPAATGLSAWVYGNGSGHFLNVWLQDSSGQVRQQTLGRVSHTGWKQMAAWFYTDARKWPSNSHISGPDTGSLTSPYTLKALVLDGVPDGGASSGEIYIDELYQLTQPLPSSAPTAAPAAQATASGAAGAPPQAEATDSDGAELPTPEVTEPPPSPYAGVQVSADQNRASYRQWGRQVSADSCNTNDALGATYKFDFVLLLTNAGVADLVDMRGYFVGEDDRRLVMCGVLPYVPIGSTARTPLNTFADLWVRQFVLLDNRGEVINRVCFSRPVGFADVVVVPCS
jgi:serine/threonine-protein kinase